MPIDGRMAAKHPEDALFTQQRPEGQQRIQHLSGILDGEEMSPECEVVFEGEGDLLETRHKKCPKNPGHANFIPVSQFTMDHIPTPLRTQENMDLIRRKIDQTVRIRVAYTSLDRPDVFSDSKAPYPYARYRGNRKAVRYGTGGVHRLLTPQPIKDKACPCHLCVASGNPEKEHWRLTIRTATHVIYDNSEAELATVDCFFDSHDTKSVKTLYGLGIDGTLTSQDGMYKSDHVEIICVTHDVEVVDRIFTCTNYTNDIPAERMHVPHMFMSELPPEGVIVSHPHGCSKRVTFGNVHYVTVPVKPMYETCTPISFTGGTECRLNPTECASNDNVSSFVSFVQGKEFTHSQVTDNPYRNIGDKACQTTVENALDENVVTNKAHINYEASCTQNNPQNQSDSDSNSKEAIDNKSSSRSFNESYGELYDGILKRIPNFAEFKYNSTDPIAFVDAVKTTLADKNVPRELIGIKAFASMLPLMNTTTQTSEQYTGEEYDQNDCSKFKEDSVNLAADLIDSLGVDRETIVPIMDTMKGSFPNLTQALPHDQQQSEWTDMIGKLFKESLQTKVEKLNDEKSSEAGAISLFDNAEVSDEEDDEDDDDDDDENVSDIVQDILQDKLKGLDATTRSILDCVGFEHMVHSITKLFDDSPPKSKDILHGDSFGVPLGMKFILPPQAAFAMRYYKESPGWFSFPSGTKVTNSVSNTTVSLPEGAEFRNATFHPKHSFISYDTDTCPGSSGAPVYSHLLGNKSTTYFPHSGSSSRWNMSAVTENMLFPMMGNAMHGLLQALTHFMDSGASGLEDQSFRGLGEGGPKELQDKDEPRKASDLDLD